MHAADDPATPFLAPPGGDFLGQPRPLWMLFSAEFWERFCFYGMRALLAVYVAATFFGHLPDGEANAQASLTYGGYTALVYATGIFGGFVADKYLGYQRSIIVGGSLMATGMFMLLLPELRWFLVGLAMIVAGNGLFKPNISTMVGRLYRPGDARRDSGFSIFYMGINLGAFFAPLVCGPLIGARFGYQYGFLAAGIGMIFGIVVFHALAGMLGDIGKPPPGREGALPWFVVIGGALGLVPFIYLLLSQSALLGYVLVALMAGLALYFVLSGMRSGDRVQLHRYIAMLILFMANCLFWALFEQAGSSLNFFARDYVDAPFHFTVFQAANPLVIVSLAPLFALLWPALDRRGRNPSIPRKFAIALIGVGFGFFTLALAIDATATGAKVFWGALALTYLLHSMSELCLSPIGLSMVTKLAAPDEVGMAMGGWFLSTAMANYLAGLIAAIASGGGEHGAAASVTQYADTFMQLWWLALLIGGGYFVAAPWLNRLMHGVK